MTKNSTPAQVALVCLAITALIPGCGELAYRNPLLTIVAFASGACLATAYGVIYEVYDSLRD